MKIKYALLTFVLVSFNFTLFAQLPETDIFLSTISKTKTGLHFSTPENITNRPGYDNQPSFTPDGKNILFVAIADTTQSDVYTYSLLSKKITQVTHTPVSEYSPSLNKKYNQYTVVRVDADSGQRLYNLSAKDPANIRVIPNSDSVGYYCELNDSMIAMFILGPANTLQVLNTKTGERKLIASDIGRCFRLSANNKRMYFVIKGNDAEWFIYSMDCKTFETERIAPTLSGSEDYTLLADDKIIMGKDAQLFILENNNWKMIADFSSTIYSFYRIAVNREGTLLALVVYTNKK